MLYNGELIGLLSMNVSTLALLIHHQARFISPLFLLLLTPGVSFHTCHGNSFLFLKPIGFFLLLFLAFLGKIFKKLFEFTV